MRVGSILDNNQALFLGKIGDVIHLARETPGVHGEHGPSVLCQLALGILQVETCGVGVNIDEDRNVAEEALGKAVREEII